MVINIYLEKKVRGKGNLSLSAATKVMRPSPRHVHASVSDDRVAKKCDSDSILLIKRLRIPDGHRHLVFCLQKRTDSHFRCSKHRSAPRNTAHMFEILSLTAHS